jgi:hypothetical protein
MMLFLCNFLEFSTKSSNLRPIIFSNNPNICDTPYCAGVVSYKIVWNITLQIFSHTQLHTGWFVNCWYYWRICVTFSMVVVPNFKFLWANYCVRSVRRHGIFEKKAALRWSHCELKAVSVMKLNLNFKFIK